VEEIKNTKTQIRLPFVLMLGVAVGLFLGALISEPSSPITNSASGLVKLREIINYIEKDYVDEVNTDELVEGAIAEMLDDLDPHTVYIPATDAQIYNSQLKGNFDGVGLQFEILRDTITVIRPLKNGPSEKLGVVPGDQIIKVNGENVTGSEINNRKVLELLRGPRGSQVSVTFKTSGEPELISYTIERDRIPEESIDVAFMIDQEIGYIKVQNFSATTSTEFEEALKKLKGRGLEKLIIDLQSNPGGYMDAATDMVDQLLVEDKLILNRKSSRTRYSTETRSTADGLFEDGAVIVLMNEGSASASEIVAGALQDHDRALIVGRRSFGKGLVQLPISLSDGSELRLTIARYYTPSGRSIQKPYVDVDYDGELTERYDHGEFFTADSIKYVDSLRYQTSRGRDVYGGGGISPDIFIPYDTTTNNNYYNLLVGYNVLQEYAMDYVRANYMSLNKQDVQDFMDEWQPTEDGISRIISIAEKNDIPFNDKQFQNCRPLIETNVKALIARSVWGDEAFYRIYKRNDAIFTEALKLFDKAEELAFAQ